MRAGSTMAAILRAVIVSALTVPITAEARNRHALGNCSELKGIDLRRCLATSRRIEMTELDMKYVPEECEESKDIEGCIAEYNKIQSILAQHNLDSVPKDCEGKDSNNIEACLEEWDLTQIILGLSDTTVPPECEGLEKENKLRKCLHEFTLGPTSYPTSYPIKSPTLQPIQSPNQPPSDGIAFTASSLGAEEVALDIGSFLMSLTTYSQTSREIASTTEVGVLSREHELAAARQHLREVYEGAFHIPIVTVSLEFVDGGVTRLSKTDSIQHSMFFGNATFLEETNLTLPTSAQLENETLDAFSGASKQAFIEKYHFLATGAPSYFGVKYRYDVSVRKLNTFDASNTAAATQEIQGIDETLKDVTAEPSGMFIGVMIVFGFVLIGTLVVGLSVLVRKRQLDRVPSAEDLHGGFPSDEVDVIGSNVESDVSISPLQILVGDDCESSSTNISHLGIDLSPSDADDDENQKDMPEFGEGGSISSFDSNKDTPFIDVELEIDSHCEELLSEKTT